MADAKFDEIGMRKGVQWEIAKGHLRALVAIDGSRYSGHDPGEKPRYQEVSEAVEAFIRAFEGDGLHE